MTDKTENKQPLPPVQINLQYVKDLSFEAPDMPMALLQIKQAPKIGINIDLKAGKTNNEKCYTVDLHLRVEAKNAENDKTLFLCEVVYGALTTLEVAPEQREAILMMEIPHIIFPFAREIVATTIQNAGFPALQINPIDFAALYRQKKAQAQNNK